MNDSAKANNSIAFIASVFITLGFFILGQIPVSLLIANSGQTSILYNEGISQQVSYSVYFILLNIPFVTGLAGLLISNYFFHRSQPLSLVNGFNTFRWNYWMKGIIVSAFIIILSDLINYILHPGDFHWQFNAEQFFPFLGIAFLMFPIQTGFEELFFRGYLFKQVGSRSRSIIFAWILTSVLFGLAHSFNLEVSEFGLAKMLFIYILLGLGLGFVTIVSQGVEIAMGFHLVNNLYVALVKTFPGSSLNTPALFMTPSPDPNYMVVESIIGISIFVTIIVFLLPNKNWKQLFSSENRFIVK